MSGHEDGGRVVYAVSTAVNDDEVSALHADAFREPYRVRQWGRQLSAHSVGWVCARRGDRLVGLVNVAWDGHLHAYIVDTAVAQDCQRLGIGTELVGRAWPVAADAGCRFMSVDFAEEHTAFYIDACGFNPSPAGVRTLP